jgi:tRNA-dihydrouridine synthase B
VARFGAGLVVSEMVASQEMVQAKPGVREKAELGLDHGRRRCSLPGARRMDGRGRAQVEANGARIIDINMGCPAKKVTASGAGPPARR